MPLSFAVVFICYVLSMYSMSLTLLPMFFLPSISLPPFLTKTLRLDIQPTFRFCLCDFPLFSVRRLSVGRLSSFLAYICQIKTCCTQQQPYTCHISSYACVGCAPAFCVLSVARLRLLSCPSRLRLLHVRFSIARPASMAFLPLLARVRT